MQDSFEDVMSKKSDEELIAIVTIDKSKYQESAIISAEREIEKRNIDIMSYITNQELIDIVTTDRSKYHEKFIDSAEKEIDKREIDKIFLKEFRENILHNNESKLKQESLNQTYNYSYNLINNENKSIDEVKFILLENGYDSNDISWVISQLKYKEEEKKSANNDMLYGGLWFLGGIIGTIADIGYIFWGAIFFGGIQFMKGASNVEIFKSK